MRHTGNNEGAQSTKLEGEMKQLLASLYTNQREDFAVVFRILYQWRVETVTIKGFSQLLQGQQLTSDDTQEILQELHKRIADLDASLVNCLSIADSLPVE